MRISFRLLAAAIALASPLVTPEAFAQNDARAVPTYESAGLYWSNSGADSATGCEVRFRKSASATWTQGLPMWLDSRDGECRGSLVHLDPDTDYVAELNLPGLPAARTVNFRTWPNQRPIAATIMVQSGSGTLNITSGGSPFGYVVYQGAANAVLDAANASAFNVTVNASYVIVRGLLLKGAQQDAIRISPNVTDVIIEDNEITQWGRQRTGTLGVDMDSAIRAVCSSPTLTRVTIQRNEIHDPRYGSNSWSDGHPAGPQAISFSNCGGNHVIRHNEIWSSPGHYYNDAIGGEDNFSIVGFPNADSDIYGNDVNNAWDDAIEAEGGNRNVRIWGNYMDNTATGVATTVTSIGPAYLFRNVYNRSRLYDDVPLDEDDRQEIFKAGSDASLGDGRRYLFHNTMLQAVDPNATFTLGGGRGVSGSGSTQPINNTVSKNNIYHIWQTVDPWITYRQVGSNNEFANDMFNGTAGAPVTNGINAAPVYAPGNGWVSESGGRYALASGTPGYDGGVRIANFNDDFLGAAPDVGAHEAGSSPMRFGIAGSPGPSIPPNGAVNLVRVISREQHGPETFDLVLDRSQPINGAVTVESRSVDGSHTIVFQFDGPVTGPGTVTVVDRNGTPVGSASAVAFGSAVEVTLTGIPEATRASISLSNVNNASVNATIAVGFLTGDGNGSGAVTASDILRGKGRLGAVSGANYLYDVDGSDAIDSVDLSAIRLRSGLSL